MELEWCGLHWMELACTTSWVELDSGMDSSCMRMINAFHSCCLMAFFVVFVVCP